MDSVTIVFTNGNIVNFGAQEFSVSLEGASGYTVRKYEYKDASGEDSAVYLNPGEVAGVILSRAPAGQTHAVSYKVSGS
jgi:hypothetical protein